MFIIRVSGKLLYPSVMFMGKAGAYPYEALSKCTTLG
jgi:hypothetical protein